MQLRSFLCVVWIASPFALMAQGPRVVSDGKRIAMRESSGMRTDGVATPPVLLDSIAPKAMPFSIAGNDKTISTNSSSSESKERGRALSGQGREKTSGKATEQLLDNNLVKKQALADKTLVAKPLERIWEENDKFKSVPLAGEVDYYGSMNNYMIDYVKKYMTNFSNSLNIVCGRGVSAFEVIDNVLKTYSIPKELKYLAVIESALNKNARSPVGALGYWQFMASTAKLMGLTVNGRRDDRTDLHKSTHAAAKYLTYLYNQLDDWLLVVAAYNSGPRPVLNAIKKTGENDFWAIKKYLPKETQNHVMAFVATATIMERLNHFLLPGLPSNFDWASLNVTKTGVGNERKVAAHPLLSKFSEEEVKKMALVRIKVPLDLEVVCSVLSVDRRQLGKWNYDYFDYLETYKKGNVYNFRIPKDKLDLFIEKKDIIEKASAHISL